jgi:hypothetical protein
MQKGIHVHLTGACSRRTTASLVVRGTPRLGAQVVKCKRKTSTVILDEKFSEDKLSSYTRHDWRPLQDLIPEIETTSVFGEWPGGDKNAQGVFTLPYCAPAPVVSRFLKAVYGIPIIIDFDWISWDEGRKIARDHDFDFDTVDLQTKCKLITAIVRNDRFCEGALVSAFDTGLILRILKSIEKKVSAK